MTTAAIVVHILRLVFDAYLQAKDQSTSDEGLDSRDHHKEIAVNLLTVGLKRLERRLHRNVADDAKFKVAVDHLVSGVHLLFESIRERNAESA